MISSDHPKLLIALVSFAGALAMLSFAIWPVFLIKLGPEWKLNNTDIGWVSGAMSGDGGPGILPVSCSVRVYQP